MDRFIYRPPRVLALQYTTDNLKEIFEFFKYAEIRSDGGKTCHTLHIKQGDHPEIVVKETDWMVFENDTVTVYNRYDFQDRFMRDEPEERVKNG